MCLLNTQCMELLWRQQQEEKQQWCEKCVRAICVPQLGVKWCFEEKICATLLNGRFL